MFLGDYRLTVSHSPTGTPGSANDKTVDIAAAEGGVKVTKRVVKAGANKPAKALAGATNKRPVRRALRGVAKDVASYRPDLKVRECLWACLWGRVLVGGCVCVCVCVLVWWRVCVGWLAGGGLSCGVVAGVVAVLGCACVRQLTYPPPPPPPPTTTRPPRSRASAPSAAACARPRR